MPLTFKREISIGTLLQMGMLLISGIGFLIRLSSDAAEARTKQAEILQELRVDRVRWERVEKYLSSRDPSYWEIIRHFEEVQPTSEVRNPTSSFSTP